MLEYRTATSQSHNRGGKSKTAANPQVIAVEKHRLLKTSRRNSHVIFMQI
jgi:hypothetical protein